MVAFCSNAVGLRRCAGSKRDEDESVPCDCIDCILDARHPVNAIIGSTSNIFSSNRNLHSTAGVQLLSYFGARPYRARAALAGKTEISGDWRCHRLCFATGVAKFERVSD
jgi:hypothetical protein